jgi:hypothetical protein
MPRSLNVLEALLPVCAALFVLPGACIAAGSASPAGSIHAYSWSPAPAECRNITPFLWIRQGSDPVRAAKDSLKIPEGHRALFSWDMENGLLSDPQDVCQTPDGKPTSQLGVWPEHGVEIVRVRFDDFFHRFKTAGGKMDVFVMDFEGGYSNWAMGGMEHKDRWLAIQNDPRFPALAKRLGFSDLLTVANWNSGRHYLQWNAVTDGLVDEALNKAAFDVARKYFPDVRCSNYGSYVMTEKNAVPDLNGHWQWRDGIPAGTDQSTALYTSIGQLAGQSLGGVSPYGQSPFAGMLLNLNSLRAMRRSSPAPIQPWLAWQRYAGDGPGRPVATVGGTPYYTELVYHAILLGAQDILFWNPHPWAAGQKPESMSMPLDEKLLDGILAEMDKRLQSWKRTPITFGAIPWDTGYMATGMQVDKQCLWRITFADGVKEVHGTLDGKPVAITRPAGQVGAWLSYPAGQKLKLEPIAR